MKTIEQIIALTKNPHYKLSDEELNILLNHQNEQYSKNKKSDASFKKATGSFKKHETDVEQE